MRPASCISSGRAMPEDKRVSEGINRIPDVVMIEEAQATGRDGVFSLGDVCVETVCEADRVVVYLSAQTSDVKKVRLRWHFSQRL